MSHIETLTLDCGLPLIVETIPGVGSLGLTWLVPAGGARDPAGRIGLSAVWEEMLHRGAGSRTSRQFADDLDRLGASVSAGVETFSHAFSATMLGARFSEVMPLVVDMVRRPRMEAEHLAPAKDLCVQAIESLQDDPQERVSILLRRFHAPEPINRSSLGTVEGINAIKASELLPLWSERARPGGSVLALAGNIAAEGAARVLNPLLAGWTGASPEVKWSGSGPRGYHHEPDETNQTHIAVAWDAPAESHEDCWPERAVTAVLSGGMSGRLFTEVREKRALCYSVYASYGTDATFGRGLAYSGTTPERAQETLTVLMAELERINTGAGRVTESEFQRAIVGMKSKLVMSGESTGARASALARDWRKIGRARSLEDLTREVDGLTLDRVNAYLARRSLGKVTVATVGPGELKVG